MVQELIFKDSAQRAWIPTSYIISTRLVHELHLFVMQVRNAQIIIALVLDAKTTKSALMIGKFVLMVNVLINVL